MQIFVRRATELDALSIAALYKILVSDTNIGVSPEQIRKVQGDEKTILLVAETNATVIATALVCICCDVMYQNQPFAVVENIIVDPEYRKIGVGRALLLEVDRLCLARDCSKVMLLSSIERVEAHQFFESAGYTGSRKKGFVKYRRHFSAT